MEREPSEHMPNGITMLEAFGKKMKNLKECLAKLVRQGTSPKKMTACIALGVGFGIFPVLGVTSMLCASAAFFLRLNHPLIQLANYAVYPLQLILLMPFYGAGSWLFGNRLPVDAGRQLIASLQNDPWAGLMQVWDLTLYAIAAWLLVSPAIVLVLYTLLKPAVGRFQAAVKRIPSGRNLTENTT
jgi:uncharacterized protein (DUF2062 family)